MEAKMQQSLLFSSRDYNQKVVVEPIDNHSVLLDADIWQVRDDIYIESTSYDIQGRPKRVLGKINEKTLKSRYRDLDIKDIPYFDSECYVPSHKNYQASIGNSKNLYAPLDIQPEQGAWKTWEKLIRHIAQEHYQLLLTYLIVMFQYPVKKLPILCLVSKDNATGKSTFANHLASLLGRNAGFYSQGDLESQFNVWVMNKLAVFEEIHDTKKVAGKLKDISTSRQTTVNRKGMQQFQFEPCVSIIINSNNEETCIQLNENDNRYLVLKVPPIPKDNYDINLDKKLEREAPAMLWYLLNAEPLIKEQSRMWLPLDMLRTKQLEAMVEANRTDEYHSIKIAVEELQNELNRDLYLRVKDIEALLGNKYSKHKISTCLRDEFKILPAEKTIRFWSYYGYDRELDRQGKELSGKPYLFKYETD